MTIGQALEAGILQNETIAYFIGRTALFAQKIGLKEGKFRFRQHKDKEMAHYACDCWDLEALTSYGWVECIGIADRSAFDLTVHSQATGGMYYYYYYFFFFFFFFFFFSLSFSFLFLSPFFSSLLLPSLPP